MSAELDTIEESIKIALDAADVAKPCPHPLPKQAPGVRRIPHRMQPLGELPLETFLARLRNPM